MVASTWKHAAVAAVAGLLLGGCSVFAPSLAEDEGVVRTLPTSVAQRAVVPLLALPAATLGCKLAVQQQLTVRAPQQAPQTLQALLEVDAQVVKLALFHMGQRIGTLAWDGQQLQADVSRWWPEQLLPARVLSDMQLALWPAGAVSQALPRDWELEEFGSSRRLIHKLESHISINKLSEQSLEIAYANGAWRLQIDSPGGMHPCAQVSQGA